MDIQETNIQEAIGQFYSFFGRMGQVKSEIDQLNLEMHTKHRILTQLDDIERELCIQIAYTCTTCLDFLAHVVVYSQCI